MFEHDTVAELVWLVDNGSEFERGKAREELSRRGYTLEEAHQVML